MPHVRLQFRRGTAAEWTAANPILAPGELAIETDTDLLKIGDGVTTWNYLPYGGLKGSPGSPGGIWVTKTSNTTATPGMLILATTTGGPFTVTLPPYPTAGDSVSIGDGGDWSVNNLTVARNGHTIESVDEDLVLDVKGARVDLIYNGTTWEVLSTATPPPMPLANEVAVTNDTTSDLTQYILSSRILSGEIVDAYVANSKLYFNPSSGTLNATTFNSLSDLRFKKNVQSIDSALDVVDNIRPVQFDWVDNDHSAYGVIAQEIEQVLPSVVSTSQDGTKSVSYDQLVPFLIRSVQELHSEVARLKEIINDNVK